MKLKGEYKVRFDQLETVQDIKRIICRKMLFEIVDKMTTEQMEKALNLQELDPRFRKGFESTEESEYYYLHDLRKRLIEEECVLFCCSVNVPD